MKKIILALLTLSLITLALILVLPAQAGNSQEAFGLWQYTPYILDVQEDGCTVLLTTFEDGVWSGTFTGTSTEDGNIIITCSGKWIFKATVTFDQVMVDGKSGTLEMIVRGSRPDEMTDWTGIWIITNGTGELENLRGYGDWWGPGAPGPGMQGDIYYDGHYEFR